MFGLDWRYLLQFSIDIDKDLAYLVRFAGPQATFVGSGHPKTIEKAFFYKIIPSQPRGMTIKDTGGLAKSSQNPSNPNQSKKVVFY